MFKKDKRIKRNWITGICLLVGLVYLCMCKTTTYASEYQFSIDAQVLQIDAETYDIQVTVKNAGRDWEGAARLIVDEQYSTKDAYDTILSLPQGSTKQFEVKVPISSVEDTDGTVYVSLWDKKDKMVAEKKLSYLLSEDAGVVSLGILSDDYASLTYWDLGGQSFYYHNKDYPIKLEELTMDNLVSRLDDLEIMIIDTFNTGILTDEQIKSLDEWVYNGGVLMVGTGSYAEDTLSGLTDTLLQIESNGLYDTTEARQFFFANGEIDLSKLPMARLVDKNYMYSIQYRDDALCRNYGMGAIGVSVYSYAELANVSSDFYQTITREDYIYSTLDSITSYASDRYSRNQNGYSYESFDRMQTMLGIIGKKYSPLNIGVLEVIIVIYVIIAGPVLYLILRAVKRREAYWIGVPVTALVGILLVFLAGRGFEVADTRAYTVTCENVDIPDKSKSYLYCYDASHKEWNLQLKEGYDYVGAFSEYSYYGSTDAYDYRYHTQKEGENLSFGIKPEANFDDSYFCAGKKSNANSSSGSIVCYGMSADWGGICGTVTNETNYDFRYYLVVVDDCMYVYENLQAGEMHDLAKQTPLFVNTSSNNISEFYRSFLRVEFREENEEIDMIAALGIGLCAAYPQEDINARVVVGVTENWENIVNDNCSEMSYGCLYTIQ